MVTANKQQSCDTENPGVCKGLCLQLEARRNRPTAAKEHKRSAACGSKRLLPGSLTSQNSLYYLHVTRPASCWRKQTKCFCWVPQRVYSCQFSPLSHYFTTCPSDSQPCSQADAEVLYSVHGMVSLEQKGSTRPCLPQLSGRGTGQVQKKPCVHRGVFFLPPPAARGWCKPQDASLDPVLSVHGF